jgi:hypothetical protein
LEAALVSIADKYQMNNSLVEQCKAAYVARIDLGLFGSGDEIIIREFIESVKVIYQSEPAAGLRGRAITTAQCHLADMQYRKDFHELMIATPEFAIDIAVKGFQQSLWCRTCSDYVVFEHHESPSAMRTKCDEMWDWIDYGKPRDWKTFACIFCEEKGTCTELRPGRDASTS